MTKRLFVCHAKSAIESTSEVVDGLESALDFPEGSLFTSSLPGYSSDTRSEDELRSMLAGTSVVLALVSDVNVEEREFGFELGAAWALGVEIVPLLFGDTHASQLPWPLRDYPVVWPDEPGAWKRLVLDLGLRLGIPARPIVSAPPPTATQTPVPEPLTVDEPVIGSSVSAGQMYSLSSDDETTVASSDVFPRLPTCEMSLEAGRALSDCVFNRDEITDLNGELAKPLGGFVDSIGGSWSALSQLQDLDVWSGAVENLLDGLPAELQRVGEWYQLGIELTTLHNLAGQLVLDGPSRSEAAENQWRTALDRFLTRAENAQIGYEKLGSVLSLLENLAGPSSERDLTNIGRSLEEVRRYAVGADRIHTAA